MEFEELAQPLKELENYEIKVNNGEILAWFRKVRAACLDTASSHAIILELQEILGKNDIDPYDNKSPYYNILLAYVYDFFGDTDFAIANIDLSVMGFKNLGKEKVWHQAISNWFYGLLLCKQGQFDRAKAKIDIAIEILSKLDKEQYHFGEYSTEHKDMIVTIQISHNETVEKQIKEQKAYALKNNIDRYPPRGDSAINAKTNKKRTPTRVSAQSNQIQKPHKKPQPRPLQKKRTNPSHRNHEASGYIAIPWLPIFQSVSAGPNGIVIMDAPSSADVTLNVIEINDIPHNIYPIKKIDRQVTLNHIFTYGLVKVEGKSMNNAQPVNINNGDYVLFSKQQGSEENDIVIVSRKISSGDFAYMVKRHLKRDKLLVSESSEENSSYDYAPIEISEDYQILGVVVAVAKANKKLIQGD